MEVTCWRHGLRGINASQHSLVETHSSTRLQIQNHGTHQARGGSFRPSHAQSKRLRPPTPYEPNTIPGKYSRLKSGKTQVPGRTSPPQVPPPSVPGWKAPCPATVGVLAWSPRSSFSAPAALCLATPGPRCPVGCGHRRPGFSGTGAGAPLPVSAPLAYVRLRAERT